MKQPNEDTWGKKEIEYKAGKQPENQTPWHCKKKLDEEGEERIIIRMF